MRIKMSMIKAKPIKRACIYIFFQFTRDESHASSGLSSIKSYCAKSRWTNIKVICVARSYMFSPSRSLNLFRPQNSEIWFSHQKSLLHFIPHRYLPLLASIWFLFSFNECFAWWFSMWIIIWIELWMGARRKENFRGDFFFFFLWSDWICWNFYPHFDFEQQKKRWFSRIFFCLINDAYHLSNATQKED